MQTNTTAAPTAPDTLPLEHADAIYAELHTLIRRIGRLRSIVNAPQLMFGAPKLRRTVEHLHVTALDALNQVPDIPAWRSQHEPALDLLTVGPLTIARAARCAHYDGTRLVLSTKEFDLLTRLAGEPRRVINRKDLLREVWAAPGSIATRTVETHASRVRTKLHNAGAIPGEWIINTHGIGYSLLRLGDTRAISATNPATHRLPDAA